MHDAPSVTVPEKYTAALERLQTAFLQENAVINLSAHRTPEACWLGNMVDSLSALPLLPAGPHRMLDVGSGGGFPALPLAICRPDAAVMTLDSTAKKMAAVGRIAAACDVANLTTIAARAEAAAHDRGHREQYDVVMARAVAALPTLLELTAPFARRGGRVVLWKSLAAEEELAAAKRACGLLGVRLATTTPYRLPDPWGTRLLLAFEKTTSTPLTYPRAIGVPGQKPL